MLHIFYFILFYYNLSLYFIKCEIPMLKVKQLDENLVNRKRLDTLEMCRIFNDGMKYSESTKKYATRHKRAGNIEDYFDNNDVKNILEFKDLLKASIEKAEEETIEEKQCLNYSHCYPLGNGVPVQSPTEVPDQVGMTTDFAPQKIVGPDPVNNISKEEDPDAIPWPKKWKYGIVPFFIDPKTYDTYLGETIIKAFDYFEKATCIRLQRLRERPTDKASLQRVEWLYITNPTGIRQCVHTNDQKANNGVQMVVFGYDCMSLGEIVHEIMHVLGFSHEHVRPTRDKYVHILWNNIKPGYKKYFLTRTEDMLSHLPYDYSSVMHYPSRAFSRNGQNTIIPKSLLKIGQRDGLSETDTVKVNYVYSAECLQRNKQYLQTTCPTVVKESDKNTEHKEVSKNEINKYFEDRLWSFGVVTYKFRDSMEFSVEERQNIAAVIRHIEKETCIKFQDASEKNEFAHSNDKKYENIDSNEVLNTDIENNNETLAKSSKENTPPEVTSVEDTTTPQISRQIKGANIKLKQKTRIYNNREPLVLSSLEYDDKLIVTNYDLLLSDDYNDVTRGKQMVSKMRSGRRHSSNIIILTRSDKPGCKCPKPGRPAGDEILSISVECFNSVNDLLHLFVHVLGLDHQHNMHDRDSYLHIMWDKLSEENKKELTSKLPPAACLGYPYDYQSVMHYPWLEIKNGQSNIMYPIWNDGWAMGHWQGLSSTDVQKLNNLYADKCTSRNKEAGRM